MTDICSLACLGCFELLHPVKVTLSALAKWLKYINDKWAQCYYTQQYKFNCTRIKHPQGQKNKVKLRGQRRKTRSWHHMFLASLYSLLLSHTVRCTVTEYGFIIHIFFWVHTTVPRSVRWIFHNMNACSDNFWMRNLFLSSSSNPPLTSERQIINNWDQVKLKRLQ